jgi:SpoIID/LytB domain protein
LRRGVTIVAVLWTALTIATIAPARAEVAVLHLDGRGFGHGVGLAQWGSKYLAEAGADVTSILATFYPGTELAPAGGEVRVSVHSAPSTVLAFPQGGEIRSPLVGDQAPGFPVVVGPGGSVSVSPAGSGMRVDGVVSGQSAGRPVMTEVASSPSCLPLLGPCPPTGGDGSGGSCSLGCTPPTQPPATEPPVTEPPATTPPPADGGAGGGSGGEAPPAEGEVPTGTAPPAAGAVSPGSVWAVPTGGGVTDVTARGRSYRGVVEAVPAAGALRLVNQLDVETYLKGMAEVPASWPAAAQQAQAIAARTYVLRAMAASGEVCDYDRCQVYVGATREADGQSAAVDATRGAVVTYGGALAAAVYSADAGGITATPQEGFGSAAGTYPYLTNVRYDTPDPLPWTSDVALADVARRFGYSGTITGVRIAEPGPSGRAMRIALDGSAGEQLVDGRTFASRLGLRSTLFTPTIGSAAVAPEAPAAAPLEEQMALPDDAGALNAAIGGTGPSLGAEASSALGLPDALPFDLPDEVDVLHHPATLLAVGAIGAATTLAMSSTGGLAGALALVGRRVPGWELSPPRGARSSRRTSLRRRRRRSPR